MGLNAFSGVASAALPEREAACDGVSKRARFFSMPSPPIRFPHWGPLFVRWELGLLEALGFGLDLSRCAATGSSENLCYVSPKSGRAVSGEAGAPYRERLLVLPGFLLGSQNAEPTPEEIIAGLKLTGYFLTERVLRPHDREMPLARVRLAELAARESA